MSKKLDEIIEGMDYYRTPAGDQIVYIENIENALREAYIAGRDETADWLKNNATVIETFKRKSNSEPYIRGYWSVDKVSIEAAKTELSLQP